MIITDDYSFGTTASMIEAMNDDESKDFINCILEDERSMEIY